jgi:hypothetical protein
MLPPRVLWVIATSLLCAVACTSHDGDAPASRFVVVGTAVARDTQTGLEWTRDDDGRSLDWHAADAHCRGLAIGDLRGWRLPTIEELRPLHGAPTKIPCGDAMCAIDPTFRLTSPYVWTSSAPQGEGARTYLDFKFGNQLTPTINPRLLRSVLCVRRP